jgi:hypothetical protein
MASIQTQVRRLEVSAYQSIMKCLAVTGLTWDREEFLAKLRIELNVSNEDHMKVRENVGTDDNVKRLRDQWAQHKEFGEAEKKRPRITQQQQSDANGGSEFAGGDDYGYEQAPQQHNNHNNNRARAQMREPKPPSQRMIKQMEKAAVLAKNLDALGVNEYICRRVKRFWPSEGGWFDCIVTDYKEETKEHCLTYDINTENESFEWVIIEELNDREFQVVDAPPVDITTGAFKLRSKPEPPKLPGRVQQNAPVGSLVKQAARATGVEQVNAIKDNLDIEEATLAAQLKAMEEESDSDDSDDEEPLSLPQKEEKEKELAVEAEEI